MPVEAHAPRIAKAIGPDFRPGLGRLDERIVGRDGVGLAVLLAVHVDAQDRRQQIADVLAGVERVGRVRAGAVAGGDVEEAVGAEVQVAAVVAAARAR